MIVVCVRAPPNSHHYDNGSASAAIYSTVKPREQRAASGPSSPTKVAALANQRQALEGPLQAGRVSIKDGLMDHNGLMNE